MKTPDKILFEYASDSVTCFHGHPLTWTEFGNCCDDFFKRNYGIRTCYWRLLRANGFPEETVRAFQAMDALANELDTILLSPAFKLNMFFKERLLGFVDPRNLLRFENEQEAMAHAPPLEYEDLLTLNDSQKASVENVYGRNLSRHITRLVFGQHSVELVTVIGTYEKLKDEFKPTQTNFTRYLEALSGLPSIVSVDVVSEQNPTVVSVRSEATPGKRRRFKITLTSLASCAIEEYDKKTVEV